MTIRLEDTVRVNPRCLLTELGDGTGVVLDLDTKFYFTLNATGVIVWKELVSRPAGTTAEELATKLEELFDAPAAVRMYADASGQQQLRVVAIDAAPGAFLPDGPPYDASLVGAERLSSELLEVDGGIQQPNLDLGLADLEPADLS